MKGGWLPDGAVARPGTTRHLEVGEEDRFRCAGIYGGGRFVDGGHLVVSQLQLEPANVAQVLEQTSRQCSQFCVADVYRQRFPLKTLLGHELIHFIINVSGYQ